MIVHYFIPVTSWMMYHAVIASSCKISPTYSISHLRGAHQGKLIGTEVAQQPFVEDPSFVIEVDREEAVYKYKTPRAPQYFPRIIFHSTQLISLLRHSSLPIFFEAPISSLLTTHNMAGLPSKSNSSVKQTFASAVDLNQCSMPSSQSPALLAQGSQSIHVTKPSITKTVSRSGIPPIVDLTDDSDGEGRDSNIKQDVDSTSVSTLSQVPTFKREDSQEREVTKLLNITDIPMFDDDWQPRLCLQDIDHVCHRILDLQKRVISLEQHRRGSNPTESSRTPPSKTPQRIKRAGREGPKPCSITDMKNHDISSSIKAEHNIVSRGSREDREMPFKTQTCPNIFLFSRMYQFCEEGEEEGKEGEGWIKHRLRWNRETKLYEGEVVGATRMCIDISLQDVKIETTP